MKRKMMDTLLLWKRDTQHRPLVLQGARQTGKTWLLREFGRRYYPRQAYFHLGTDAMVRSYFEQEADPVCLLEFLEVHGNLPIHPTETLVILDDIQECPAAWSALASFAAELPGYSIVAVLRTPGPYPLPKLQTADAQVERLHALDFEEFLWACREVALAKEIRGHYRSQTPLNKEAHQRGLRLFASYLAIGGLPAAVLAYRCDRSFLGVPDILSKIRHMDLEDITRCCPREFRAAARACYWSLPLQLQKENPCFQYRVAQKGGTRSSMDESIQWLAAQHMAVMVRETEETGHHFKLYPRDVGLCSVGMELSAASLLRMEISLPIRHLVESCLAAAFESYGYGLSYWTSGNKASLPFLVYKQGEVTAIDLHFDKSKKSRSLFEYQKTHNTAAIRISSSPFSRSQRFYEVPCYACFCI